MAVAGGTSEQMQSHAAALLPEFRFQELRLDYLDDPRAGIPALRPFLALHPEATFLATCRPVRSGGLLAGGASEELEILTTAARAGFALVDLSLESAEELGAEALAQLRSAGATVQLSFHDFTRTGDLNAVLARMHAFRPDLYKVVPTATCLDDSLQLLDVLRTASITLGAPIVAMAMGEAGLLTRVLGPRDGSAFTFAAATEAEATAPGQLTARTLTDLYRIGHLGPDTRVYGVAGDPIHSSLSPLMLNTAFGTTSTNAVYLPLRTGNPEELLRVIHALPLAGCSVTMPLKQTILPLLDEVDPLAARIGAVNTIQRTSGGHLRGFNTDAAGIVAPLESRRTLRGAKVLVLGAGGAARAAVFGCLDRGAHVFLWNRTAARAQALAAESGAVVLAHEAFATEDFDILINATPAGMRSNGQALPLKEHELRAQLVFDLVYNPLETPLLALARRQGREVIPGVEMFVHQGARQFELWTGIPAPIKEMRRAVLHALGQRQS